jgi:hypothetical protein
MMQESARCTYLDNHAKQKLDSGSSQETLYGSNGVGNISPIPRSRTTIGSHKLRAKEILAKDSLLDEGKPLRKHVGLRQARKTIFSNLHGGFKA